MATIKKFEDLFSWQKSRQLAKEVYKITRQENFLKDRGLSNQIQRAAVSVMANQAEGLARGTRQELINYFYIAKSSAAEVQSHLYVALDQEYIDASTFQHIYPLADEVQRLIESFIQKVKQGAKTGLQHKKFYQKNEFEKYFEETLKEQGLVFTPQGVMSKEKAMKLGLEIIKG